MQILRNYNQSFKGICHIGKDELQKAEINRCISQLSNDNLEATKLFGLCKRVQDEFNRQHKDNPEISDVYLDLQNIKGYPCIEIRKLDENPDKDTFLSSHLVSEKSSELEDEKMNEIAKFLVSMASVILKK